MVLRYLGKFIRYYEALVSALKMILYERSNIHASDAEQGILPEGGVIAVKKLAENSPLPRDRTFGNEVTNLMALQHKNIIEFVGFCHEAKKDVVNHNGRYVIDRKSVV